MTLKQFINLARMIQFTFACDHQTHHGAHCKFEGIVEEGPFSWYSESCNLEPIMVETNCPELDQYGIDSIEDVEAWIESHGGIDIDDTIKWMYDRLKK